MRKRLVNQQLEPRRLNALAKIFLALFALLLTPNLVWAQDNQVFIDDDAFMFYLEYSQQKYKIESHSVNFYNDNKTYPDFYNYHEVSGVSVTFSSSNTSVATINPSTGEITPVGLGTTEITASFEGNAIYFPKETSYMLTFVDSRYGLFLGSHEGYGPFPAQAGVHASVTNASNITHTCIKSGKVSFDYNTRTLTLENATIDGCIYSYGDLTIDLKGANFITAPDSSAIKCTYAGATASNLTIKSTDGTGTLVAKPATDACVSGFGTPTLQNSLQVLSGDFYYATLVGKQMLSGGNGSIDTPYILKTAADIKNLANYYKNELIDPGSNVKLSDNIETIDCTGITIETIGSNSTIFSGIFDGNGKTISNLTIAPNDNNTNGLFSHLNGGIIKDLTLSNCTISGGYHIGAFVGAFNDGEINNCHTSGCTISTDNVGQIVSAGGIAGELYGGTISDCTVTSGSIASSSNYTTKSGSSYAGGIVGWIDNEGSATVSGCEVNSTAISSTHATPGAIYAGGVVSCIEGSGVTSISNNNVKGITSNISCTNPTTSGTIDCGAIAGIGGNATFTNNTYEYGVTTETSINSVTTTRTGYEERGIGNSSDEIDEVQLAGVKKITINIDQNSGAEYVLDEETIYPLSDDYYALPEHDVILSVYPDLTSGFKPRMALNDETIDVTAEGKNGVDTDNYNHTEFTFTMPNADVTASVTLATDLWVEGILVTSTNASNVLGGSTARVIYDAATNTLTLNGAYIVTSTSAGIKSGLANLKVVLSGGQSEIKCTGEDYYAFEGTTENATVTFSSTATSAGYLDITTAGYNKFFKDITPAYDGITHFDQTSVNSGEYFYLIRKSPWTGSGTEDDPYLVSTTTELKTISTYVNQGIVMNYSFKLNNDIDWSVETGAFTSIGVRKGNYTIFSFEGTFDGNNKTISNLTSENGLFNYVMNGGSIKNLTLTGCTVIGGSTGEDAAGLVADFRSSGKIEKCSVKNSSITNNNYTNITSAGGIVGYMTNGTIDNCSIENVTITMGGSPTYTQSAGGIVGHTYESTTITNCEVKVNAGTTKITNTAETDQALYAGAIVGWRERQTTLTSNTYQAGVVIETRKGTDAAVTKSGNKQRGLGDGDDVVNGAELAGVKKITVTKNDKGTVEYMSNIYREDGSDIYVLPYSLSGELTIIKGTSSAGYDEPTIAIKTVTNNTDIDPETSDGTSEGLYYAQWEFEMPNDDVMATILFAINLAKEARNFVIADRDYTSEPLPVTEIKTTLDDLDGANPAFIELTSGTHFNITGYKDSKDVALGTTAPTNAGNYKVTIQGIGDCTGTVTLPFVISRLAITPTLIVSDWIYGGYDVSENGPSLTDGSNLGNGAVTFYFKKDGENEFHTMEVSSTTDAGNYSVYATIAQSTNYEGAQTETKTFNITQLDISNATVTLDNTTLIYNGSVQTVNVTTVSVGDIEVPIDCYEVSGNTGTEIGDYTLTVTAKTMDSSGNPIKNNFTGSAEKDWKIKYRTVTADELGLSENQTYATYFNNTESFDLPDGIVAYIITGVSGTTVTTKRISYIPKNVAVLVENGTSTEDAVDAATDNQLLGTADAKDVSTITGGAVYVLYKSEFVKTTTGTIPANRCYLVVSGGAGARSLSISHGEGNDTGIDNLVFDENGTEKWYDLRGRRIEKPTKAGLYIRNGEKIVVNDNNK